MTSKRQNAQIATASSQAGISSNDQAAAWARSTNASHTWTESRMTKEEIERKTKDLVRLALSREYARLPLKRDDIKDKILSDHSKALPHIFERAQKTLRSVFGMEMVEVTKDIKNSSAKSWIVRSSLSDQLRKESIEVIDRSRDEAMMGFIAVILSLILVNGRVLDGNALGRYLRKLKMDTSFMSNASRIAPPNAVTGAILPDHTDALTLGSSNRLTADTQYILSYLVKHGYLDRGKVVQNAGTEDNSNNFEYRWGPRAKVEFPEKDLVQFIADVMDVGDDHEDDEVEEPQAPVSSTRRSSRRQVVDIDEDDESEPESAPARTQKKTLASLMEDIARASGEPLEA